MAHSKECKQCLSQMYPSDLGSLGLPVAEEAGTRQVRVRTDKALTVRAWVCERCGYIELFRFTVT